MADASQDASQTLMALFVKELIRRMGEDAVGEMKAADLEVVRKFLSDNSVTIASVRRGDFGELAQRVAEDMPFPEDGETTYLQ